MSMPNDDELKQLELELSDSLKSYHVTPVQSGDTARLLQSLQPAFNELVAAAVPAASQQEAASQKPRVSLGRLIRSQIRAYSRAYWAASAALFVMLLFMVERLGLASSSDVSSSFTILMPAALLGGLLYSFRTWNREMRMVESISPYPPALLLLARSLIVTGVNVVLGVAATLYMEWTDARFDALSFLTGWLSLYLLISGLVANIMLRKGLKPAFISGIVLWFIWNYGNTYIRSDQAVAISGQAELAALFVGLALLFAAYRRSLGIREIK
ncbi:hypothetical protein [Paenibacillus xylaniclasticus]|uniref:hypothetical protein n=1 Tax=Paenibacillus xylaniclasticus TaxID=588083 RepID=UPI000FDAED9F|nr:MULTISPECIES: hypothetical protein [Paenibacillus]GFN31111.1 hypothetical protein PCURB6_13710 [Paenibacillus curdlanolyticus]